MPELPREVPGGTVWERAVSLAGLLAELGVQRVVLEARGERRELAPRSTDLPREIAALVAAGGGVLIIDGHRYAVTDAAIARDR